MNGRKGASGLGIAITGLPVLIVLVILIAIAFAGTYILLKVGKAPSALVSENVPDGSSAREFLLTQASLNLYREKIGSVKALNEKAELEEKYLVFDIILKYLDKKIEINQLKNSMLLLLNEKKVCYWIILKGEFRGGPILMIGNSYGPEFYFDSSLAPTVLKTNEKNLPVLPFFAGNERYLADASYGDCISVEYEEGLKNG